MKKQFLNLGKALSKAEQKQILGGLSSLTDADSRGTCGYKSPSGEVWCGLPKSQAVGAYNNMGGNWCCDSCGSASYCN